MDEKDKRKEQIKNYSRVPQSFVFDCKALYRKFEKSSSIIQDIMIFYIYNKLNVNLFGELEFTMKDFCDAMGYNRTGLQRTIETDEEAILDNHTCDSLFEYALYRCLKENVVLKRVKDNGVVLKSYKLLDSLSINYDRNSKKQQRRSYSIKFSDEFMEGVFKEYFVLNYDDYSRIHSRNLELMGADRNFYLILCKMIAIVRNQRYNALKRGHPWDSEKDNCYKTNTDIVCMQLGIDIHDPKNKKRKMKARLDNIQCALQSTSFTYEFERVNCVHKVGEKSTNEIIIFHFPQDSIDEYDERQKAKFIFKLIAKCTEQYARINAEYKRKIMSSTLTEEDEAKFYGWFSSSEHIEDFSIMIDGKPYPALGKFTIFKNVYQEIYSEPYPGDEMDLSLILRK